MSSAPTTTTEPAPAGVAALAALAGVIGLVGAGGYAAVWTLPFEGFLTTGEPADRYTVPLLIVPLAARIAEAGLALAAAWLLARRSAPGARIAVNLLAIVLAWGAVAWAAARIGFLSGQESLRVGQLALSVSSSTWVTVLTAAALLWLTLARRRAATAYEDDEDTADDDEDPAGDAGDFEEPEPAARAGDVPEGPLPLELAPLWARVRRGRTGAASWLDAPAAEGDPDRATLAAALRLARRALDTDPGQLPAQLIGRLDPDTAPGLAPLLAEAAAWTASAWLRPLAPALVRPGGPVLATASCAEEDATAVALTADGRTVTGYRNGSIRLGDVWDGSWSGELAGHRAKVNAVAVTPDGRYAVSGSADRGVRLWELGDPGADSGQPDPVLLGRLDDEVTAVALTADARVALAGTSTGALHAWSLEDAAEIGVGAEHTGRVRALAIRSDGAAALSAAEDDAFLAWELDGDRAPFELELDTGVGVTSVAFTADHRLALAGYLDGTLALWDLEAAKVATFTGHATAVDAVVIAPDGRTGASASLGHTFRLWDLEKARSSGGRAPGAVELAAVSGTGTTALVAAGTGRLELRAADGTLLASDDPHGFDLLAVAVSADGRRAVWGGEDGAVRVWTDLRGVRRLEGHDGMVTAVALGPGGRRALTGDDAPGVLSWDLELGDRPARSDGHEGIVTAVAIAADGRLGASASSDGVVRLWDLEDGTELDKARLGPGWITALAVCTLGAPAGGDEEEVFVLAGRADGRLLLHDFAAGDGGTVGDGHDGGVTAVVVAPGGRLAASCGADATIAVHDLRAGTPATGFTADFPFLACAFTELPGGGTGLVAIDASGATHRLALAGFPGGMRADRPDDEVRAPAR